MSQDRIMYLDIAKGIGILMIMLLHMIPEANMLKNYLLGVSVPTFFFLTGITMGYGTSLKRTFKEFFVSKFKSLMIPYIIFGLVYFVIYEVKNKGKSTLLIILKLISTNGISVLWFLGALFWSCVIVYVLNQILKLKKAFAFSLLLASIIIISYQNTGASLVGNPWQVIFVLIVRVFAVLPFVELGIISSKRLQNFEKYKKIKLLSLTCILFVLTMLLNWWNGDVDINRVIFGTNLFSFYLLGGIGAWLILLISICLKRIGNNRFNSLFVYFGRNSLIVMCTHEYLGIRSLAETIVLFLQFGKLVIGFIILCLLEMLVIKLLGKPYQIISHKIEQILLS